MHLKKLSFFIALLFKVLLLLGQDSIATPKNNLETYLHNKPIDFNKMIISPVRWNKNQWLAFGLVTSSTAISYIYDQKISNTLSNYQSNTSNRIAKYFFEPLGNKYIVGFMVVSSYGYGCFSDNSKLQLTMMSATKALTYSAIVTTITKYSTHRKRPIYNDNPYQWNGISLSDNHLSFFSGHSIYAFALATVVTKSYKEHTWLKYVTYPLATGVALSRVYTKNHWMSDVIIGSTLGYAIGSFVYHSDQLRLSGKEIALYPSINGLSMRVNF